LQNICIFNTKNTFSPSNTGISFSSKTIEATSSFCANIFGQDKHPFPTSVPAVEVRRKLEKHITIQMGDLSTNQLKIYQPSDAKWRLTIRESWPFFSNAQVEKLLELTPSKVRSILTRWHETLTSGTSLGKTYRNLHI